MARFVIRDVVCDAGHVATNTYCDKDDEGNPVYPRCEHKVECGWCCGKGLLPYENPGVLSRTTGDTCAACKGTGKASCGKPTKQWFGIGGKGPDVQTWKPIVYDGVEYKYEEDWNRYLDGVAENLKIPRSQVVVNGPGNRKLEAEEAAHRGWLTRKRSGIDDRQLAEYQREQKRETGRVFGPRGR